MLTVTGKFTLTCISTFTVFMVKKKTNEMMNVILSFHTPSDNKFKFANR